MKTSCSTLLPVALVLALLAVAARAAGEKDDRTISLAGGKLRLTAPEKWKKVPPRNNIIEYEFSVPAVEADADPGRVTLMGAGGSVEQNLERWTKQFSQPDGSATKDRTKVKQQKIAGVEVHTLDVSGTYDDRPPFANTGVERKGYRMLAAVVASKELGNYFIKFYGPERLVEENAPAFQKMIEGLERK